MPRIRTIKPEFCTSEQVADCSPTARLLFVLMWLFCDDAGRHPANSKRLKMEAFPGDAFSDQDMNGFIDELINAGLLVKYTYANQTYWQVTGWKHQKIEKPSYKYPPLDESGFPVDFADHSTTSRRPFDDSSPPERSLPERSLPERKGVDVEATGKVDDNGGDRSDFNFILGSGILWNLSRRKLAQYQSNFPNLDLPTEFRKAAQWLLDNPGKRRPAEQMPKFLGSWLGRAQNDSDDRTLKASKSIGGIKRKTPTFEEVRGGRS